MWHGLGEPIFANWFQGKSLEERVIELNNIIDDLIDNAHDEYMQCSNETEKVRLDGKIKAYWEVKNCVENILVIK